MSRCTTLAMCLSLAACEAAPPTPAIRTIPPQQTAEQPPAKPAIAVEKPAPAPQPEPVKCERMTRAGTCWGQKPKVRLQKLTTP